MTDYARWGSVGDKGDDATRPERSGQFQFIRLPLRLLVGTFLHRVACCISVELKTIRISESQVMKLSSLDAYTSF